MTKNELAASKIVFGNTNLYIYIKLQFSVCLSVCLSDAPYSPDRTT